MLDRLPVDPARVHAMPASGGEYGDDVDAAAQAYAEGAKDFLDDISEAAKRMGSDFLGGLRAKR